MSSILVLPASSPSGFSSTRSGIASSSTFSSSWMVKANLIILWILLPKPVGSSKEKPEVNKEVSYNNQIKSLTVLSLLSASALFLSSTTMECSGLISKVFLETMYEDMLESLKAWAFMILSMLADQPHSEVTKTHGDSDILEPTKHF